MRYYEHKILAVQRLALRQHLRFGAKVIAETIGKARAAAVRDNSLAACRLRDIGGARAATRRRRRFQKFVGV